MNLYKTTPGLLLNSGRLACRTINPPFRITKCRAASRSSTGRNGRRKGDSLLDNGETGPIDVAESISDRIKRRRRQRKAEDGQQDGASDQLEAGDGWQASEWGPAEQAPPEETEWGWAQDSWSGEVVEDDELREQPMNPESEGWDATMSHRERRRSGAKASSTSTTSYDEEDEEDAYNGAEINNGGGQGNRARSSRYEPGLGEPDIALLSPQELERILPVVPFSAQAAFFNGGPAQAVQRWGASLALTILLSKAALLAATSLTWPLWWPWAQAASKNYALRKQSVCAGLWRTQVLEVEARGRPRASFGEDSSERDQSPPPRPSKFSTMRTTRIILGDPDGAQTELVLPHDARFSLIDPGQPAELIVLSTSTSFESFKAVKDVYLPDCGLWLSEYPFLDRTEFLELSLEVEREAAAGELEDEDVGDDEWQGAEEEGGDEEQDFSTGEYYYPSGPPPPRY